MEAAWHFDRQQKAKFLDMPETSYILSPTEILASDAGAYISSVTNEYSDRDDGCKQAVLPVQTSCLPISLWRN